MGKMEFAMLHSPNIEPTPEDALLLVKISFPIEKKYSGVLLLEEMHQRQEGNIDRESVPWYPVKVQPGCVSIFWGILSMGSTNS